MALLGKDGLDAVMEIANRIIELTTPRGQNEEAGVSLRSRWYGGLAAGGHATLLGSLELLADAAHALTRTI